MITLDGTLTIKDVHNVAFEHEHVELGNEARNRMAKSRQVVDDLADANDESVYGVNTGFGNLKDISIDRENLQRQQLNLLRSHTTAVGAPMSPELTRAVLLVRANALAIGVSGVRPELVDRLCKLLNHNVLPVIPSEASADNACALSNVGLVLTGEGDAIVDDTRITDEKALEAAELDPFEFGPKEGISLISGTPVMTAQTALAAAQLDRLVTAADIVGAWTFKLIGKEPGTFDQRVFDVRPVDGHAETAANVRRITGVQAPNRAEMTQDPLSIRCIPQVNGSLREHLQLAEDTIESELESATDNPLVFPDGTARSCGNFNGQHVAGIADLLALTTRKVGQASERRADLLLSADSHNPHLATDPGLESGLARAHYSAASLVTEAKTLDTASDRSFITSTGQEDLHTAGNIAGANLLTTVDKIRRVIAIEFLCCLRVTEQTDSDLSPTLTALCSFLGEQVSLETGDISWAEKISGIEAVIRNGEIVDVTEATGIDLD